MAVEVINDKAYQFWGSEKPEAPQLPIMQDTGVILVIEDKNPGPISAFAEVEEKPFTPLNTAERLRFGLKACLRRIRYGHAQAIDLRGKYKKAPAGGENVLKDAIAHDYKRSHHRGRLF